MLEYKVGDILTVLDRSGTSGDPNMWTGVNGVGKVGWFVPQHTVTYLGDLPTSSAMSGGGGALSRESRKGSNRKISRDMISAPTGNVQHTGHVGPDGCYFGDVAFISGTNGRLTLTNNLPAAEQRPQQDKPMTMSFSGRLPSESSVGGRLPSTGSENGFSSLSRADSDVSDSAPLLAAEKQTQPRMGHAIGYLRKPDKHHVLPLPPSDPKTHQYQSISDDEAEFGSPLDLGPSLMDEVFSELGDYSTLKLDKDDKREEGEHGIGHNIVDTCNKLADKVTTLTLSRKHKGKKAAFVKPIKASDEKTLEKAIKMANQLASKSMQDLDKRGVDDMFSASPEVSPITPNSPTKKFSFKFPTSTRNRSSSPKRHLTEEGGNAESLITPGARDAYKALIEGKQESFDTMEADPGVQSKCSTASISNISTASSSTLTNNRLSLPPSSSVFSYSKPSFPTLQPSHNTQPPTDNNPLPLPPKEGKSHVTAGKRHVRKNPLILTSGAAANMARRLETEDSAPTPTPSSLKPKNSQHYSPCNDAFEDEIACSMDALDQITDNKYSSPKTSLEDDPGFRPRGVESDEVRIMTKVLGDTEGCVQALDLTDWNVHRAIKLVKLKSLIRKPGVKENDMKVLHGLILNVTDLISSFSACFDQPRMGCFQGSRRN